MGEPMNDIFATFSPTKFPNDIIKKIFRRVGLSVSECLLYASSCSEMWCATIFEVWWNYQKFISEIFQMCFQMFGFTNSLEFYYSRALSCMFFGELKSSCS